MSAQIAPTWILRTEHRAGVPTIPVLVNQLTGDSYTAQDVVDLPPGWGGSQPAAQFVARFGKHLRDERGKAAARAFLAAWPEGPQLTG